MSKIRYTLVSDGSSDRALIPILDWALRENGVLPAQPAWADLRTLTNPPKILSERIKKAIELYPCDLLFVHRDAETNPHASRKQEILSAVNIVQHSQPAICVVPVRMQEAWLLINEDAIRFAADNPNGKTRLKLPVLKDLENLPNPKKTLHDLLYEACGLSGRRLERFRPHTAAYRIAQFIEDFSPLRNLSAFRALEADIRTLIDEQGWR